VFKNPDQEFIKLLNDKYFTVKSINQLLSEHNLKYQQEPKEANKKFYFRIKKDLEERSISEELFMSKLSDDLLQTVNFSSFVSNLQRLIT
jgi:DNA-binding transcriptional MerR regulator